MKTKNDEDFEDPEATDTSATLDEIDEFILDKFGWGAPRPCEKKAVHERLKVLMDLIKEKESAPDQADTSINLGDFGIPQYDEEGTALANANANVVNAAISEP